MDRPRPASALAFLFALGPCLLPAAATAGTPEVRWQPPVTLATGGGHQGPWRQNESDFDYVDAPAAGVAGDGSVAVVWVDQAAKDLRLQRFAADGQPLLPRPVDVSRSPTVFSWLPRIALPPAQPGTVLVLWQEIIFSGGSHGGDILFARSGDGGRTFSESLNLSSDPAGSGKGRVTRGFWHNGSLDLAAGTDGRVYAAWTDYEGDLWFTRSTDAGASFASPLRLAQGGPERTALGPSLAVAPDGTVHLAWTVGEQASPGVLLASSGDQGRSFSEPRIFEPGPGHVDAPKIAADGAGTLHLAFGYAPEGPFRQYGIAYSRRAPGDASFAPVTILSDPRSDRYAGASFPGLAVGDGGRVQVLGELSPLPGSRPTGLGLAVSSDGGRTFSPLSVLPGSLNPGQGVNGSLQGMLGSKLAAGGQGAVAVVNSTFDPGRGSAVRMFLGKVEARD